MATTPEGAVKKTIKAVLTAHDCWYYMPVPGGYGAPSIDFICAYRGRMFGIEAKAPGKKASPRQINTMSIMNQHNIPTLVCDGDMHTLVAWIKLLIASTDDAFSD